MGFTDIFKGKQYKSELETLQQKYEDLQSLLTPEMQNAFALQNKIRDLDSIIQQRNQTISDCDNTIISKNAQLEDIERHISDRKTELVSVDEEILVQEFGLYKPHYDFANALEYKEKLSEIRAKQKAMIKNKTAVSGFTSWQVNGSASKGKKMVSDTQKLLLRAFNNECDEVVGKVKYTNFDASLNRINKSAETISKLGTIMGISINRPYLNLKIEELKLAFEYQQKKQEEKEAQKAARAEMREAAKLQKEIEAQRKKIEKEQTHYQTAYEKLLKQLESSPDDADLIQKKSELETQLQDIDKAMKDIDYREANQRAGYVYIISNIGAFGENVYKIGMISDTGGVNDESFNQSTWEGLQQAQEKYGKDKVQVKYVESSQEADYTPNIETFVEEDLDLIIGVGYKMAGAIEEASKNYPDVQFAIIDHSYEKQPKNVTSLIYEDNTAAYLAGLVAAKKTETNKVAFIGGIKSATLDKFEYGFRAGVKAANPKCELTVRYLNSFSDSALAKSVANQMHKDGVDVIYTAAGAAGTGAIEAEFCGSNGRNGYRSSKRKQ